MPNLYLAPIVNDADLKSSLGKFIDLNPNWTHIESSSEAPIHIYDSVTQQRIAALQSDAIPEALYTIAVKEMLPPAKKTRSTTRGAAAGNHARYIINDRFERSNPVNSSILGYFDSANGKRPCRLTKMSKDYFESYQNTLPFIQKMDTCFQTLYPEAHQKQYLSASNSGYSIAQTAFSTITVNYNFQTALHVDKGDFKDGFGNLVVLSKDMEGGHLLFPKYELAISLKNGDFLAMDVHQYHCNSPMTFKSPDGYRLSFVGYFRSSLNKCAQRDILHQQIQNLNTEALIDGIFARSSPIKQVIGTGKNHEEWWQRESDRFRLVYKGRQYTLYDKLLKKKIPSLQPAYVYAKNI